MNITGIFADYDVYVSAEEIAAEESAEDADFNADVAALGTRMIC
ncbi:hypothetical protein [Streptomyces sp. NPDC048309]